MRYQSSTLSPNFRPQVFVSRLSQANLVCSVLEEQLRYLDRLQPLALVIMRLALGAIMLAHGYQNTFRHLHEHVRMVACLGLPAWLGYVSSFTELIGGILVLAGLLTRPAAFAICIDLIVAIAKVHW